MSGIIGYGHQRSGIIPTRSAISVTSPWIQYSPQPVFSERIGDKVFLYGCLQLSGADADPASPNMFLLTAAHRPSGQRFLGVVGNGDDIFFIGINNTGVGTLSDIEEMGRSEGDDMIPLAGLSFLV